MKIVLIRHLCTPGNEKKQYIGRTDESLSENAVEAFQRSRNSYPTVQSVIASPMKRCIETARLIYPRADICTEPMLRECDFGLFEGRTYEELKEEPAYTAWLESGGTTAFPGGEAQEEFRTRCVEGIRKWINALAEEKGRKRGIRCSRRERSWQLCHGLRRNRMIFYHWQVENGGGYEASVREEEWLKRQKVSGRGSEDCCTDIAVPGNWMNNNEGKGKNMKKKKSICLTAAAAAVLISGCVMNTGARVYDSDRAIASSSNSYNLSNYTGGQNGNTVSGTAEKLEGMDTVWRYEADEENRSDP